MTPYRTGPAGRMPRTRSSADEEPPRRTHTAILALFTIVVLSLAGTLALIATTSPA